MSSRTSGLQRLASSLCMLVSLCGVALAQAKAPAKQPPTAKSAPAAGKAVPPAKPAAAPVKPTTGTGTASPYAASPISAEDAGKKAEILSSSAWRRAMFEFNEWLTGQQLYSAQEVVALKKRFGARVKSMSASELEQLLADLNLKFQIMDTEGAKEARAWMASYLSVMSDKKREEILKEIPDFDKMTAGQLNQLIMKIQNRRNSLDQQQAAFAKQQTNEVNFQLQTDRIQQQAYINAMNNPPQGYSPYRSAPAQKPFENAHLNNNMSFYVGPFGGVGMSFSPSSF